MIVATAGHVDHGKTLLIEAITGTNTDRLPEEKDRSMSIDLGFAYHDLEDGFSLGFVDVPGHERFINNMLAGIFGIDFALLVIATDDGPMPQTHEHLAILHILGVRRGAVVLTKIDKVTDNRLAEVNFLAKELLLGTSLAGAPIFPVSSVTKKGIGNLLEYLKENAGNISSRKGNGNFRLAIDRSFSVKGAGIVVTGSVVSGKAHVGDQLVHSGTGRKVKIRAIRSHNKVSQIGIAGERCALNIRGGGLDLDDIGRGDWIFEKQVYVPTDRLDAVLTVLSAELDTLKHWTPAHLHLGSGNVTCRIAVLKKREIKPGNHEYVQLVVDKPVYAVFGDRFIIRDISSRRTIAGGSIIDPFAKSRGRTKNERIKWLICMSCKSNKRALSNLFSANLGGVNLGHFFGKSKFNCN